MIRNDREYRVTKARAAEFKESLSTLRADSSPAVHPKIRQAQLDAVASQLADLQQAIAEYDSLKSGRTKVLELSSLAELPRALIQGRISAGLTQKDLAERLGILEQQVQRYESTDYAAASFTRLVEVADALGLRIKEEIFLPDADLSAKTFVHRLTSAGVDGEFSRRVLLDDDAGETGNVLRAATIAQRVFGWPPALLLGTSSPLPLPSAVHSAFFKVYGHAREERTVFLAAYGRYVAQLAITATPNLCAHELPSNATDFRKAVLSAHPRLDLLSVLETLWRLGVIVVPLSEGGGFHGACWRIEGRNVIVVKQRTMSEARWLHDILHEAHHASSFRELQEFSWFDDESMPVERMKTPEEKRANRFAGDVLLDGKAEEIAKRCAEMASLKAERLKDAVVRVAAQYGVSVGAVANYVAWRVQLDGINWWGTATNLQERNADPWTLTREFLIARLNWGSLDKLDRELLAKSLEGPR